MKKLNFKDLEITEEVKTQFAKEGFAPEKVVRNLFASATNKKYERGMTVDNQRVYFKTYDKIALECDLEDTEFDFLYDVMKGTELPPIREVVSIVDYLASVKESK